MLLRFRERKDSLDRCIEKEKESTNDKYMTKANRRLKESKDNQ